MVTVMVMTVMMIMMMMVTMMMLLMPLLKLKLLEEETTKRNAKAIIAREARKKATMLATTIRMHGSYCPPFPHKQSRHGPEFTSKAQVHRL